MTVKALIVRPTGTTEVREIEPDLATLNGLVGGWLEGVGSTIDADWHAYCDEEGKLKGSRVNEAATRLARHLGWPSGDFLVGTVVFLGQDGSEEADVPERLVRLVEEIV